MEPVKQEIWISVEERLPEDNLTVLVCCTNQYIKKGKIFCSGVAKTHKGDWVGTGYSNITHWMPLPLPPFEVKE